MSYRDAQYPGQEYSGDQQYWTKQDYIENDRDYKLVKSMEQLRIEFPSIDEGLLDSEKYQAELKEYAKRCGVSVKQLLNYHRTGKLTPEKS